MEDAACRRDRMQQAVHRLRDRLHQVQREEDQARRWEGYNELRAERDALAKELAAFYPDVTEQLGELVSRIAHND